MLFVLMRNSRPLQVSGDLFSLNFKPRDEIITIESLDEISEEEEEESLPESSPNPLEAPTQQIGIKNPTKGYLIYQ